MHCLPLAAAFAAVASSVLAQATCNASGLPTTLATQNPFFGNNLYGHPNYPTLPGPTFPGFSFLMDLTTAAPIDISRIDIDLYDAGGLVQVNSTTTVTSPNQVGATAPVTFYIVPAQSWVGNEANQQAWGPIGTGTLTVSTPHADSPIVFSPPINLPAGQWGVLIQVPQTTNGPNPGPLHPMLNPTTTPPMPYVDAAITMTNVQFQRESWTNLLGSGSHTQNLEIHYQPMSGFANWTSFGAGCVAPNVPVLQLAARPVIGTTIDFQTTNIQPGTLFNFWLFGYTPDVAGLPLDAYGMPGCALHLQLGSPLTTSITAVNAGQADLPLMLPNDPSFSGQVLFGQSAPMTAGANAAGFYASNAVCVAFGQF